MKRFLLVAMILASAASLYAAELKVSGDMEVRGVMDGINPVGGDSYSYNFFDYDLNLDAAFVANENATVFTRLALDKDVKTTGYADFSSENGTAATTSKEESLTVERAYLNYKFFPFLQLNTGLMGGGQWATTFGDKEVNVMRVQLIGALSEDMIFIFTYQKDNENAKILTKTDDNEKDDQTTYYLSSILKFGGLKVLPLFTYVRKGINYNSELAAMAGAGITDAYDASVYAFTLGLEGDFGLVGMEAEGCVKKTDTDGLFDDIKNNAILKAMGITPQSRGIYEGVQYGAYLNIFAKIDPLKVGVAGAYASSDKDAGTYEMGDDFDFTIVADDLVLGNTYNPAGNVFYGGLMGMMAGKVYAEVKALEKLTANIAFAYGKSTNTDVSDVKFWEIDAKASWAFDANASYTVAYGYANIDKANASSVAGDVTSRYRLYHKFNVKF